MNPDKKRQYNAEYYRKHKEKWRNNRKQQQKQVLNSELRVKSLQYRKDLAKTPKAKSHMAKRMISAASAYNEMTKAYNNSRGMEKKLLKQQRAAAGEKFIKSLFRIGDSKDQSIQKMSARILKDFRKARLQNSAREFVRAILDR